MCLICGKKHIEYYHHINPQKNGRYDHVSNIAGLCWDCHYGPKGVHNCQETADRLEELKSAARQKYQVGLLNSVMPKLIEEVSKYCTAKGIIFNVTDGKATAETRDKYGLQKDHCIDAYAISLAGRDIDKSGTVLTDTIYIKRRFKKKSKNIIAARNQRKYYLDGKLVAVNRHKATDQKENSLEEFMADYAETHSEKECNQMMHKLVIKPAKRTYTFHKEGQVAPIHPGDIVKYKKTYKINGKTHALIFPAVSVLYKEAVFNKNDSERKEREWEINIDRSKHRKAKFCKPLESGCLHPVGKEDTKACLAKVAAEEQEPKPKRKAA